MHWWSLRYYDGCILSFNHHVGWKRKTTRVFCHQRKQFCHKQILTTACTYFGAGAAYLADRVVVKSKLFRQRNKLFVFISVDTHAIKQHSLYSFYSYCTQKIFCSAFNSSFVRIRRHGTGRCLNIKTTSFYRQNVLST